ncbi:MAG: type B DNA-directed DNA polymerase [Methanomicrobiales archaeon]|nr:type B DNA-directed DNA polymerase [Methanomicrobiales archaeon]
MWIFDSRVRESIELWVKREGTERIRVPFAQNFYLHLPDPHRYSEMLEALAERYTVEECTFRTIHGEVGGYRVGAGREVAEAIERQTGFAAELYNVDIRQDQRWFAENDLVPCAYQGESRFTPDFDCPLAVMELRIEGDPSRKGEAGRVEVRGDGMEETLTGREDENLEGLFGLIASLDPDLILMPDADLWTSRLLKKAGEYGLRATLSRTGRYRRVSSRSYWSYGRMEFKGGALLPEGRVLIDTTRSFNYREGGLRGVLLASRLSGITPALASRFTPGTLVSSYEVYGALREGIAVPFRKRDAESGRRVDTLRELDRGGMIFQPVPGVYTSVDQIDFTSLYPSIIVKYNLSPETLSRPDLHGFLPGVLEPLLELRKETKRRKKSERGYEGCDSILKWMLVTCFGYTGYRNAKFGRIEVHEQITCRAREILLRSKEIAEEMGCRVLHGIVDCLWVQSPAIERLKARVEGEIGLTTECEHFDWITFLPMSDGYGAYNRYYGRRSDGILRLRGIMARRGDTPPFVAKAQEGILWLLKGAAGLEEVLAAEEKARSRYLDALEGLASAPPDELAISRRISRLHYSRRSPEASAVAACLERGMQLAPGMEIAYVVRDSATWEVDLPWEASHIDLAYYRMLLGKAWEEVAFTFDAIGGTKGGGGGPGMRNTPPKGRRCCSSEVCD